MRGWNFTFVKLLFKLLKKKMHRKTKKDEWKWVLPCSFSGARTVFPQSIQSWCQRGQSRNSGGSSWNDNFSLTCPRCPADNTLLQGSQCSSPALYRYILGKDRERDERRYIQVYGINEQRVGKKKIRDLLHLAFIPFLYEFISAWGRSALTLQEGLQVLDILCVLVRVRFVEWNVQWIWTDHQPCNTK